MKAILMFVIALGAALLLAFGANGVLNLGMGLSGSAVDASELLRGAIAGALAYAVQHKVLFIAAFMICLIASFIPWNPTIRER